MPDHDLLQLINSRLTLSNPTGEKHEYSNLSYAILGHVIGRITGKRYQQYISENILGPLGMINTTYDIRHLPNDKIAKGYRWEDDKWSAEPMLGGTVL